MTNKVDFSKLNDSEKLLWDDGYECVWDDTERCRGDLCPIGQAGWDAMQTQMHDELVVLAQD